MGYCEYSLLPCCQALLASPPQMQASLLGGKFREVKPVEETVALGLAAAAGVGGLELLAIRKQQSLFNHRLADEQQLLTGELEQ